MIVNYHGFVYTDAPSPSNAQVLVRKYRKHSASSKKHPKPSLFFRGIQSSLEMSVSEKGLLLSELEVSGGALVLQVKINKIFYTHAMTNLLVVFSRRSSSSAHQDESTAWKSHLFIFDSPDSAQLHSDLLTRLVASLGFRRVCFCPSQSPFLITFSNP